MNFAAFGVVDLADGPQVERIGYEGVKCVGRDGYDASPADCSGRAIQSFR